MLMQGLEVEDLLAAEDHEAILPQADPVLPDNKQHLHLLNRHQLNNREVEAFLEVLVA